MVAAAVAGDAYYLHWRNHPNTLTPFFGDAILGSAAVGQEFVSDFDLSGKNGSTIDITKVRLHVVRNTADATITLVRYTGPAIGETLSADGSFDTLPSAPGHWRISHKTQLLYVITPHRAGVVRVEGADITYSVGHRHQTQSVGITAQVAATVT